MFCAGDSKWTLQQSQHEKVQDVKNLLQAFLRHRKWMYCVNLSNSQIGLFNFFVVRNELFLPFYFKGSNSRKFGTGSPRPKTRLGADASTHFSNRGNSAHFNMK